MLKFRDQVIQMIVKEEIEDEDDLEERVLFEIKEMTERDNAQLRE